METDFSEVWILRGLWLEAKQRRIQPLAILKGIMCLFHPSKRNDGAEFAGGEGGISIAKLVRGCMVVHLERVLPMSLRASLLRQFHNNSKCTQSDGHDPVVTHRNEVRASSTTLRRRD